MNRELHLCQIKDGMHQAAKEITDSTHKTPKFKFMLDDPVLRCPHRDHCDPSRPCEAMQDGQVRQRLARIDDEIFKLGFTKGE